MMRGFLRSGLMADSLSATLSEAMCGIRLRHCEGRAERKGGMH